MVTVAGHSIAGSVKKVNQDAYCALTAMTGLGEASLIALCDGVGGLSGGEVASSTVISEFSHWFEDSFPIYASLNVKDDTVDLANIKGAWTSLIDKLNSRLRSYGQNRGARLGTTLTALLVFENHYVIGHVGDCRAYLLRQGSFEQLTRDQTLIQREIDAGRIGAKEALTRPESSVILQAVGAQEGIDPVFTCGQIADGDTILLCCDGFYRRLDMGGLAHALGENLPLTSDAISNALAQAADQVMDAGEKDNITAVCLHVSREDFSTSVLNCGDEATTCLEGDE